MRDALLGHIVLCAILLLSAGTTSTRATTLPPYSPGRLLVNPGGYAVERLFGVEWGTGEGQVGQRRLDSRGAISYSPRNLSVSHDGRIILGDEVNERILVFKADGTLLQSFPAAYGGYYSSVDDNGQILTLFRRPLAPFAVAIYEGGRVVEEIEVPPMLRNPLGDRIRRDMQGQLFFQYRDAHQYLTELSEAETLERSMCNYVTEKRWSYTTACREARLGAVTPGIVSFCSDQIYRIEDDGRLSVIEAGGKQTTQIDVPSVVTSRLGVEAGANPATKSAVCVVGDDAQGNIVTLVRTRIRKATVNPWTLVMFGAHGTIRMAMDCYPCAIHFGSEAQFYPSTITVTADGTLYQLCTEGEKGVQIIRIRPPARKTE